MGKSWLLREYIFAMHVLLPDAWIQTMRTVSYFLSGIIAACIIQGADTSACTFSRWTLNHTAALSSKAKTFQHSIRDSNESAEIVDETEIIPRTCSSRPFVKKQSSDISTFFSAFNECLSQKTPAADIGLSRGFITPLRI
jgi:hypothetical protein